MGFSMAEGLFAPVVNMRYLETSREFQTSSHFYQYHLLCIRGSSLLRLDTYEEDI